MGAMSRQNQQVLVMVWRRKRSESKMTAKFPTWGSERLVTPFSVMDNTEEKGSFLLGKMVSSAWDVLSLRFWENPRGGVQWAAGEKSRLGGEKL